MLSTTADQPPSGRSSLPTRVPFFYGWVILVSAILGMFASGPGQTYTVSVFLNPMLEELGWSRTLASGLYTAGSLTAAICVVAVGRMLDRYGARMMMAGVGIAFGLALLWMSTVSLPIQLYIGYAAIRTLGQGSLGLIPTTLVAIWFVRLRGRATALTALGTAGGQMVFPLLAHSFIATFGWRGAWIALAVVTWGLVLPIAVLLVRRSPESIGVLPDGDIRLEESTDPSPQSGTTTARSEGFTLKQAMHTRSFWLLLYAGSSQSLIGTALVFHLISFFDTRGVGDGVAAVTLSIMAPLAMSSMFISGYLSDKIPNRYLLVVSQVGLAIAMLWALTIDASWQAYVFGGMLGFSAGFTMTTTAVIWPNYYGRAHIGSIRGVATSGMVAAAALGPLPFGIAFDITDSYSTVIVLFLAMPVTCAFAALLALPPAPPVPVPDLAVGSRIE
ncbi:MAG: MFS transporter [Chloroflexota bacterium]|nr:MFS transporter [Chloroflexota bacterium]